MRSRTSTVRVGSILAGNLVVGAFAVAGAQVDDSPIPRGGVRWGLVDAVGYGGLGFGVGVLAAWALEESSAGPVDPPGTALSLTGPSALSFGIGSPTWDVGPPGTTLAVIGATTVAGTVAGAMIGRRAERVIAEGGRVDGVHRAAVVGGAVLAGGTLGALAAIPFVTGEGEGTLLGSDEETVALLVLAGTALGTLFVRRHWHELGYRELTIVPARSGRGGYGLRVVWR